MAEKIYIVAQTLWVIGSISSMFLLVIAFFGLIPFKIALTVLVISLVMEIIRAYSETFVDFSKQNHIYKF